MLISFVPVPPGGLLEADARSVHTVSVFSGVAGKTDARGNAVTCVQARQSSVPAGGLELEYLWGAPERTTE